MIRGFIVVRMIRRTSDPASSWTIYACVVGKTHLGTVALYTLYTYSWNGLRRFHPWYCFI